MTPYYGRTGHPALLRSDGCDRESLARTSCARHCKMRRVSGIANMCLNRGASKFAALVCMSLTLLMWAPQAGAETVTFKSAFKYSGTAPAGSKPWLVASFVDDGPETVKLSLSAANLIGSEFVSKWAFNLDPSYDPADLAFSFSQKSGFFANPDISTGIDSFKAGSDGYFDILFEFATQQADRFEAGDALEVTITRAGSLEAESFKFLSHPTGEYGPYYTAAHIQSIGADGKGSCWVTVPEPSGIVLVGIGLLLAGGYKKRRRRYNPPK